MATAKSYRGTVSGKTFITVTMGPKEAGSVLASLEAGPSNENTDNVAEAIASLGLAADYSVAAATLERIA
jgi:hypothetical protein